MAVLVITVVLCGISFGSNQAKEPHKPVPQTETTSPQTTNPVPTETIDTLDAITLKQGDVKIITLSNKDLKNLESWTSSNEAVVSVDSGGRIDANAEGTAKITAKLKNNKTLECDITVTKADEKEYVDTSSTCISANQDILEKNIYGSYQNPYYIKVNRQENCVTVYTYDENGE